MTQKDLDEDIAYLAGLHQDCMTKATEFEAAVKSRDAELEALATAKKIIKEATDVGAEIVYDASAAASFVQLSSVQEETSHRALELIKRLARENKSTALAQLAERAKIALRMGATGGDDPFAKVKGLIKDSEPHPSPWG